MHVAIFVVSLKSNRRGTEVGSKHPADIKTSPGSAHSVTVPPLRMDFAIGVKRAVLESSSGLPESKRNRLQLSKANIPEIVKEAGADRVELRRLSEFAVALKTAAEKALVSENASVSDATCVVCKKNKSPNKMCKCYCRRVDVCWGCSEGKLKELSITKCKNCGLVICCGSKDRHCVADKCVVCKVLCCPACIVVTECEKETPLCETHAEDYECPNCDVCIN